MLVNVRNLISCCFSYVKGTIIALVMFGIFMAVEDKGDIAED